MNKVMWFISYKLKNNVSIEEFLKASKECSEEVLSKQKGFISWEVVSIGDTWVDIVKWDTVEDAKKGETAGAKNPAAKNFYSFIDMKTCKLELYELKQTN